MQPNNKILVVEDDRDIRRGLQRLLESEGYAVELAENGQQALTLLQSGSALPDAIILDLMMPVMDGFQFRVEQEKNLTLSKIPVIIMTADGHVEDKQTRLNAVAALRKPADVDLILDAVKSVCGRMQRSL